MEQDRQQRRGINQRARGQRDRRGMGSVKEVGIREREGTVVSNEVQGIVVDHVVNRSLIMAEAARFVHPNLKRSTVNSIMRTFRQQNVCRIYTMLYHYIYSKLHIIMHVNSLNMLQYSYSMIYWQYTLFYPQNCQNTPWWWPWPCTDRSAGVGSGGKGEGQEWHTAVRNKEGHWGKILFSHIILYVFILYEHMFSLCSSQNLE